MSHFSVAVLSRSTKDVEALLAPYSEFDETLYEFDETDIADDERRYNESQELRDQYPTPHSYLTEYCGYTYDEDSNTYGYMCNPNAKWDWFEQGGRFDNMLTLKPGRLGTTDGLMDRLMNPYAPWKCNQARLGELRFDRDEAAYQRALRFWEVAVEGSPQQADEKFFIYLTPEYYTEKYESKEEYAESQAGFRTYAFITPDGTWYDEGEMGYFGISMSTSQTIKSYDDAFQKYVMQGDPSLFITIVDCHI